MTASMNRARQWVSTSDSIAANLVPYENSTVVKIVTVNPPSSFNFIYNPGARSVPISVRPMSAVILGPATEPARESSKLTDLSTQTWAR